MANRIEEQHFDLFADRVRCHWERGTQTRMYDSAIEALRRKPLAGTAMGGAQCGTIRLLLSEIAGRILLTARWIWIHLREPHSWRDLFMAALERLRAAKTRPTR